MATTTTVRKAVLALALAAAGGTAAQEREQLERLERAFWQCDHASTRGRLDGAAAARCSVVFETLKQHRFGGDYAALQAWWHARKAAEHGALDQRQAAVARRTAP